ncbi:MAG: LCP family protein [Arcanobacterium sp.]|nr:LCP family protein [Arcanobacterium sp.]MDY5589210.1 LCP family protein [Arcanobacterium sp.]
MGKHTATANPAATPAQRGHARAQHGAAPAPRTAVHSPHVATVGPQHALPPRRAQAVWRTLGLLALSIVLIGASAFATLYVRLQSNIDQFAILRTGGKPAQTIPIDQKAGQPLNIMLLGSDARLPGSETPGMRSDTAMLVHISADRTRVDVVSIPRDTLVDIPACRMPDGTESLPQTNTMFNAAFAIGGESGNVGAAASCSLATVEQMSKLFIDGFAVVDFQSFQAVVDSIGGVEMCFKENIADPEAALKISAGCHNLTGAQALGIARARHSLGDGSDISRIGRQQELVFQIIEKLFSKNLFTNTQTFYQVASDVTRNLSTSQGLGDLRTLTGIAYSLRGLSTTNGLNFLTLPVAQDARDPNRVRATESADQVWEALREDKPIPASALTPPPAQNEVVVRDRQPKSATTGSAGAGSTDSTTAPNANSTAPLSNHSTTNGGAN